MTRGDRRPAGATTQPSSRSATKAPSKQTAEKFGRFAETMAALWLMVKGYRVVARRYRSHSGEIDLILQRRHLLVFAEVKARSAPSNNRARTHGTADGKVGPTGAHTLTPRQQDRIARAAEAFVQTRPDLAGLDWRFDLILITRPLGLRHIKDAWRPGLP